MIMEMNREYALAPDTERGFKREGHKERVEAFVRVFNGQPQLVFFYGKTRYTFNFVTRGEQNPTAALMSILGYRGIDSIPSEILHEYFTKETIDMRREMLKLRGV
ncbi:MAG: hypothetical protein PHS46_08245 [Candidatus Omnitrophica bacterium]|nr:hypothetical protein [Candidatus Omnitrophota bacterium]